MKVSDCGQNFEHISHGYKDENGKIQACDGFITKDRIDALIDDPEVFYDDRAIDGFVAYCEKELTLTDGSDLHLLDSFKLWKEKTPMAKNVKTEKPAEDTKSTEENEETVLSFEAWDYKTQLLAAALVVTLLSNRRIRKQNKVLVKSMIKAQQCIFELSTAFEARVLLDRKMYGLERLDG